MKRLPAILFAAILAFTLAACGDDDDGDGGGDGGSGNKDVQAYCDSVDEYVAKVEEVVDSGDAAGVADLQSEATDLANKSAELSTADLDEDDAKAITDCTQKATDAAAELANVAIP